MSAVAVAPAPVVEPVAPDDLLRWPLQPLLDASKLTRANVAAHLGITTTTLRDAERRGLTDDQADRWAVGLGHHPANVWGWDWFVVAVRPEGLARSGPSYLPLADGLRARILAGELAPGDRLPPAKELAAGAGISPRAAGRALAALGAEGLVDATRGRCAVVLTPDAGGRP